MAPRAKQVLLVASTTVLCAVACALLLRILTPRVSLSGSPSELVTRWLALPPDERTALVAAHTALSELPDSDGVVKRVDEFRAATGEQQARWCKLNELMDRVLAQLPPAQRKDLLALSERARAEAVYRILETQQPEQLKELRERWGAGS